MVNCSMINRINQSLCHLLKWLNFYGNGTEIIFYWGEYDFLADFMTKQCK
jgi:hypothetical protein